MQKQLLLAVLSSILLLLASCQSDIVYSYYQAVPLTQWQADSVLTYQFEIDDTIATYEIQIAVRHTQQYPYQNMWLFVSDTRRQDTIEFYLANDRGEWLGQGNYDRIDMPVLYEENYRFEHAGKQIIRIQHGMRENALQGITDVGLIIKRNGKE